MVACAIDGDIIDAVRQFRSSSRRAIYDISVVRALQRLGARVHLVSVSEPAGETLQELICLRPGLVFNLAFSATPGEPAFAGALELLGIPFTGSGGFAIGLANDKVRSRQLIRASGIRVPPFVVIRQGTGSDSLDLEPPFIVKPVQLGNSQGIRVGSVVDTREKATAQADRIWRRFQMPSVCDAFIVGREFQVGLIERRNSFNVTGIVELHFVGSPPGRGFKSECFKSQGELRRAYDYTISPARLPKRKLAEMATISRHAAAVLDIRGYAKVDMRMDGQGRIFVIEVNANPGLWSRSVIWNRGGFAENIRRIMVAANSTTWGLSTYR